MRRLLLLLAITLIAPLASCGGEEEESFDNLPDCVVDHASLGEAEAIAHCLVDFPELHSGFANQAECVAFVEANGGFPDSRDEACTIFFEETGGV
jgi:hypothetical protein